MPYIKRTDGLAATAAGRECFTISSRRDEAVTVAEVEVMKPGDIELSPSQFDKELASIASHNAANPAPPTPIDADVQTIISISSKADSDVTPAELQTLVLTTIRRLREQGMI
jgi:hypothetical protein